MEPSKLENADYLDDQEPQILCENCDWNSEFHERTSYESQVRMVYAMADRGIWRVGNQWLLKDQPVEESGKDSASVEFLRQHTTIPLVPEIKSWKDNNRLFTLSKRVEGRTLADAWPTLTQEEKKAYAAEVAGYVMQLRKLYSNTMGSVDNELLRDRSITKSGIGETHYYIGATEQEWWEKTLIPGLSGCTPEKIQELKQEFPPCAPFTFTHGDLNAQNIMVHNGRVTAILDWEYAGFYPVWYETYALNWIQKPEWGYYLRKALPFAQGNSAYPYIQKFYKIWMSYHPEVAKPMRTIETRPFCQCRPFMRVEVEEM